MGRSQSLRLEDVLRVLKLVREVHELHGDRRAQRSHIVAGMQELLRADKATLPVFEDFREGGTCRVVSSLTRGFSDDEIKYVIECASNDGPGDPGFKPILRGPNRPFAVRREDVMPAPRWRDTKHAALYCRGANTGPFLYAGYMLENAHVVGVGLHREWNGRPFSVRDSSIAEVLVRHFGSELLSPETEATLTRRVQDLSPQLRQVLVLLLGGLAEKQVAAKMNLSPHTVHGYVKDVYRRLQVRSRPELLSLFLPGRGASAEGVQAWRRILDDTTFRHVLPAPDGNGHSHARG